MIRPITHILLGVDTFLRIAYSWAPSSHWGSSDDRKSGPSTQRPLRMNVFSVIPGEAFRRKLVLVVFSISTQDWLNMETKLPPKEVELFGTLPHPYRDHNRAAPEKPHKVTILHRNTNLVKYRLHICTITATGSCQKWNTIPTKLYIGQISAL